HHEGDGVVWANAHEGIRGEGLISNLRLDADRAREINAEQQSATSGNTCNKESPPRKTLQSVFFTVLVVVDLFQHCPAFASSGFRCLFYCSTNARIRAAAANVA